MICGKCMRWLADAADVKRWHDECGPVPAADPPWAKALCWTTVGLACHRTPSATTPPVSERFDNTDED